MIGHEITHGFDDQGRQYDGNGNAVPWWSQETIDAFSEQAQCFVNQYGNYSVPEIADIVGEENANVRTKKKQIIRRKEILGGSSVAKTFFVWIRGSTDE